MYETKITSYYEPTKFLKSSSNKQININDPTGPTGPTGDQDQNITNGLTGPTGPTGPTGDQDQNITNGLTGPTGINGIIGDTGCTGPRGCPSLPGDTGIQGIQGLQGITGPKGYQGPIGPTGLPGMAQTGPTGPQGIQGSTGPTGVIGIQGVTGSNNEIGKIRNWLYVTTIDGNTHPGIILSFPTSTEITVVKFFVDYLVPPDSITKIQFVTYCDTNNPEFSLKLYECNFGEAKTAISHGASSVLVPLSTLTKCPSVMTYDSIFTPTKEIVEIALENLSGSTVALDIWQILVHPL